MKEIGKFQKFARAGLAAATVTGGLSLACDRKTDGNLPEQTNDIVCLKSNIPETIGISTGPAPHETALWGGAQSDGRPYIEGYQWDFEGDGTWDSKIQIDPINHVYKEPGTYHPKYRVKGSDGSWSKNCTSFDAVIVTQP